MTERDHETDLPEALRARLRAMEPRVFVPPDVDDRVLSASRCHLATVARRHRRIRWAAGGAGAGAAAAVVAGLVWLTSPWDQAGPASPPVAAQRPLPGDIDASGRIDILDAFALARHLESGGTLRGGIRGGDMNGDGRVNRSDVDAIAQRAVVLDTREQRS